MKVVNITGDKTLIDKAGKLEIEINGNSFVNPSDTIYNYCLIDNDEILGGIDYSIVFDEAEILYFYIVNSKRGNGYSKILLSETMSELKKRNIKSIFLEVNEKNTVAINLYKKFNFIPFNKRLNYYGSDSAIMMKVIL